MHPLDSPHFAEQHQAALRREAERFRLLRRARGRDDTASEAAKVARIMPRSIERDSAQPPAA